MWQDNLIKLIENSGLTPRQIAEKGNISEKTVLRIKNHKTESMQITTIFQFCVALNCDIKDIFTDTTAVVGGEKIETLQKNVQVIDAERDYLTAENNTLKKEVEDLKNQIKLLEKDILHKDEVIALHKIILGLNKE